MILRQILIIIVVSAVIGAAANVISPNGIPFVGKYRSLSGGDEPIIPPTAEEGDPPFIAIDVAEMEFSNHDSRFIDAREPAEFECGTIPGSINIPFDYLPEYDLDKYVDSALGGLPRDHPLIVFCSGEECESSLHLARTLQELGYTQINVFFGGAREWENFGLEMQRITECGE